MMRLEYQEQEEYGKVITADEPGDKGWAWSPALVFRLHPVSS